MRIIRSLIVIPSALVLVALLSACGLFGTNNDAYSYKNTRSVEPIAVPQALQQPQGEHTLTVPEVNAESALSVEEMELPPQIVKLADIEKQAAEGDAGREATEQTVARQPLKSRATKDIEGASLLIVEADLDKVWPNMEPALKELGFKIGDASRGDQVFAIEKELPTLSIEEKKVDLAEEKQIVKETYQIHLKAIDNATQITVHNKYGKLDGSALADHLLLQIQERIGNPE